MPKNTAILAIDCATGPASVAVWMGGRVAAYAEEIRPASQSACLIPMIERVLREAGIGYENVSHVAATTGPGSFTGIRVGLAAAGGICFAASIKGLGFTTLETLAFSARGTPVLAALNAGKGEWYYQAFDAEGRALFAPRVGPPEAAKAALPGAALIGNVDGNSAFPRADTLAALAALAAVHIDENRPLRPFYIRPPDAIIPPKKF